MYNTAVHSYLHMLWSSSSTQSRTQKRSNYTTVQANTTKRLNVCDMFSTGLTYLGFKKVRTWIDPLNRKQCHSCLLAVRAWLLPRLRVKSWRVPCLPWEHCKKNKTLYLTSLLALISTPNKLSEILFICFCQSSCWFSEAKKLQVCKNYLLSFFSIVKFWFDWNRECLVKPRQKRPLFPKK